MGRGFYPPPPTFIGGAQPHAPRLITPPSGIPPPGDPPPPYKLAAEMARIQYVWLARERAGRTLTGEGGHLTVADNPPPWNIAVFADTYTQAWLGRTRAGRSLTGEGGAPVAATPDNPPLYDYPITAQQAGLWARPVAQPQQAPDLPPVLLDIELDGGGWNQHDQQIIALVDTWYRQPYPLPQQGWKIIPPNPPDAPPIRGPLDLDALVTIRGRWDLPPPLPTLPPFLVQSGIDNTQPPIRGPVDWDTYETILLANIPKPWDTIQTIKQVQSGIDLPPVVVVPPVEVGGGKPKPKRRPPAPHYLEIDGVLFPVESEQDALDIVDQLNAVAEEDAQKRAKAVAKAPLKAKAAVEAPPVPRITGNLQGFGINPVQIQAQVADNYRQAFYKAVQSMAEERDAMDAIKAVSDFEMAIIKQFLGDDFGQG